ncbi:MAG: DUF433 domain-containing protein [Candidatus Aenigmatarchaeota archaeon]
MKPKVLEIGVKIVRDKLMGGVARIAGTRIRVMDVVEQHLFLGSSPEYVSKAFDIPLAAVYEALAFYYQHPEEVRKDIKNHEEFVEKFRKQLS